MNKVDIQLEYNPKNVPYGIICEVSNSLITKYNGRIVQKNGFKNSKEEDILIEIGGNSFWTYPLPNFTLTPLDNETCLKVIQ